MPPTSLRVLIAVSDVAIAEQVALTLNHGRYHARVVERSALTAVIGEWRPHLVVVDLDAGGARVIELVVVERGRVQKLPLIALTRRGDLRTKVAAFDAGADDIMTLPLAPEELVARARALMRRSYGATGELLPVVRVGELELDMLNRCVRVGALETHLTSLELGLLYLLVANEGSVISQGAILDAVWGPDSASGINLIERHVSSLRVKLSRGCDTRRYIETVRGRGYRFSRT